MIRKVKSNQIEPPLPGGMSLPSCPPSIYTRGPMAGPPPQLHLAGRMKWRSVFLAQEFGIVVGFPSTI
jgi:hypothetical protein